MPRLREELADDGAGRADRVEADERRAARLEVGHAVMVDDSDDVGLLDARHRLAALVVVDEHDLAAHLAQQVGAADQASHRAVRAHDDEGAHGAIAQRLAHVLDQIVGLAGEHRAAHDVADGRLRSISRTVV